MEHSMEYPLYDHICVIHTTPRIEGIICSGEHWYCMYVQVEGYYYGRATWTFPLQRESTVASNRAARDLDIAFVARFSCWLDVVRFLYLHVHVPLIVQMELCNIVGLYVLKIMPALGGMIHRTTGSHSVL